MDTLLKTAMMYRAIMTFPGINYTKGWYEQNSTIAYEFEQWAELFGIKENSLGHSRGQVHYKRLKKYHDKYILDI